MKLQNYIIHYLYLLADKNYISYKAYKFLVKLLGHKCRACDCCSFGWNIRGVQGTKGKI